ncbi:DNA cytosine methyltransferase [Actinoallomurus acaciae]|uniref:Cytosine-specific methyltransferase n=1 Tax=Actinoallomurus acaciae TaxID=502577 RepID=A0ABV5YEZ7_9ACTN
MQSDTAGLSRSLFPEAANHAIKITELFAGCGGFTQGFREFRPSGFKSSPFRSVGAVDWDIAAASTFAANFADDVLTVDKIFVDDIKYWNESALVQPDIILGGPPCQGFSSLGRLNPDDPRNELNYQYMRMVSVLAPKIFVIENVDRFIKSREYDQLRQATKPGGLLSEYALETKVLNAADYGAPQNRRRAIVLGTHRDLVSSHPDLIPLQHPEPTHAKDPQAPPTLFDTRDRKPWVPVSSVFEKTYAYSPVAALPERVCSPLGVCLPGVFGTYELHLRRNPTPLSLKRYASIPPGGNRYDSPADLSTKSWLRHRTGSGDVMGRLHIDRPSVTIRTEFFKPEKGRYLHPYMDRPITHYEAALIQGFPDEFLWCGTKIQIARQIGNAIPVQLSRALAEEIYFYLKTVR